MIAIDTIVSIKSGDEYGGKYTGKLGIVKDLRMIGLEWSSRVLKTTQVNTVSSGSIKRMLRIHSLIPRSEMMGLFQQLLLRLSLTLLLERHGYRSV